MPTLTVQDLINQLNEIKDKTLPVFIYHENEIYKITMVDNSISDRVDINSGEAQ